jgi:hypothetical protein
MTRHLLITPELLSGFLVTGSGIVSILANPLPQDAEIVGCEWLGCYMRLEIKSAEFTAETPDPLSPPIFGQACPNCLGGLG